MSATSSRLYCAAMPCQNGTDHLGGILADVWVRKTLAPSQRPDCLDTRIHAAGRRQETSAASVRTELLRRYQSRRSEAYQSYNNGTETAGPPHRHGAGHISNREWSHISSGHGIADDRLPGRPDSSRQPTMMKAGKKTAAVAKWLAGPGLCPSLIISSPWDRAADRLPLPRRN